MNKRGRIVGCAAAQVLEIELKTYEAHRVELLGANEGKWVLIHDGEVVDTFESQLDAIRAGYKRFKNVPFLVKQIVAMEVPQDFVSNHLAF